MTIRKTLLIAFLLASVLPSLLLAVLAFRFASDSMHAEIEQSLQVEAATVSQDIDKLLLERLQNARMWSRLEVMQEIQVNDVDKRLSKFLTGVKVGYRNVYHELLCADGHGRIVASSDPRSVGVILATSETMPMNPGEAIRLEPIRFGTPQGAVLPIDAAIPSMFNRGQIGHLRLLFNWTEVYGILDRAGQGSRQVLLVDRSGRIIAASAAPREQGLLMQSVPADLFGAGLNGIATRDGAFLDERELTIGFSRSRGFQHVPGLGWTAVVIQPSRQAFAPIHRMATIFALLLVLISSLAVGLSVFVAGRIAQPIASLTQFTRDYVREQPQPAPPRSAGGEVGELTDAFVQTMTALEKSRADLVRASKLAAVGELSAVMAHEIRTPIGILRSSAQMLAREPTLSEEGRELTSFIQSETERLNGLVSTLLDSTRTREPQKQPHDLNELIRLSVGLLAAQAEQKKITVTAELPSQPSIISCDAEQMTQVLLNLLQNAVQMTPTGGRVTVSNRDDAGRRVVEIADDGPGIGADALAHVFQPFFTRRDGGIGLGLSVVHHVIARHHGEIVAGTSSMGGALFTISLPQPLETP